MERQLSAAPESTDEELAAAVSAGDRQAFGTLYERYFRGLYDLSIRMMRDRDAAADNVQNTFLNAWQSLKQRTVSGNVGAWLYTIARNNAINELRRRNRLVPLQLPDTRDAPARDYAQVDGAKFSNPAEVLEDRELVDLVWNSAAALSPREYSLLHLQLRKGLSNEEMAQSLGVPRSNIYVMLSRLR